MENSRSGIKDNLSKIRILFFKFIRIIMIIKILFKFLVRLQALSTKYYDYKNSNKSTDGYVKAFCQKNSHLSKHTEQDLTRWYSEMLAAMNKLNIGLKEQAVLKANHFKCSHFFKRNVSLIT